MKFTVYVEQQIVEVKKYEITAKSDIEAAVIARTQFFVGEDNHVKDVQITERTYEVYDGTRINNFDDSHINQFLEGKS
ncbi:MAG: hypothetical protein KDD44_00290 [Bdellovibrionales bacterium]|nr:hypothetical protein [Bdellovibrionales bacterium]